MIMLVRRRRMIIWRTSLPAGRFPARPVRRAFGQKAIKNKQMKMLLFIAVLSAIISCNTENTKREPADSKFDIEQVKAHITEMNKSYGDRFVNNDTAFYADRYCTDAQAMPEKMPAIKGREAIQKYNYNDGNNKEFKIEVTATDIYGSAGAVIEEGIYNFPDGKGGSFDKGKFIAVWKQEGGKWKLYREIWNTDNPPMPSK
jgi:ketosteroid isomerase-like protein